MKNIPSILAMMALLSLNMVSASSIFSCTVKGGKQVDLDYNKKTGIVTYAFGKNLTTPEIRLQIAENRMLGDFRRHYGGVFIDSVGIPNENIIYVLANGQSDVGNQFASVAVYNATNYEQVVSYHCLPNTTKSNLESIKNVVQLAEYL